MYASPQQHEQVPKFQGVPAVQCPDCVESDIIEDHAHGDMICSKCGSIVGDRIIDTEREWREFESDNGAQSKSRVGGPSNPLLDGADLTTSIGGSKGDDRVKGFTRAHMRGQKSENKSLLEGFKRIDVMAEKINLPERHRVCNTIIG